jgi:hypothetical protein
MAGVSKNAIFNVSLATLAGGAAGFAVYAMPAYLLERLIGVTGLPNMMTAAQPPLGTTARLSLVAAAFAAVFLLVWLVLRAFDPPAAKASGRAGRHLDADGEDWLAPAPREIRAPAPVRQPLRATELDAVHRSAVDIAASAPVNDTLELENSQISAEQPLAQPALMPVPKAPSAPAWDVDPLPAWDDIVDVDVAAEWDSAPMQVSDAAEDDASTDALLARLPSSAHGSSVASLVQRLNAGLAESEWPVASEPSEPSEDVAKVEDNAIAPAGEMDDRLRNVLQDLHKMAGNNG